MRNVYSFLTFNQAFVMRRTCRQIHQNDIDIYQYSCIVEWRTLYYKQKGHNIGTEACKKIEEGQNRLFGNPSSIDVLRATLRNENLQQAVVSSFIFRLLTYSETDNTQALSILIEDGRSNVNSYLFDMALRKNRTGMAALLQQGIREESIIMCSSCSTNIACYTCALDGRCRNIPSSVRRDEYGELPDSYQPPRWCRECVMKDKTPTANKFCGVCSEYICRPCAQARNYRRCSDCRSTVCFSDGGCRFCSTKCDKCRRPLCGTCITGTVAHEQEGLYLCRPCRSGQRFGYDNVLEHD